MTTGSKEELCGTCIHHRKENEELICKNPDSECYGCYTEYRDSCDSYEERLARTRFSVTIVKNSKNS